MIKQRKVYLAGALFSEGEVHQRKREHKIAIKELPDFEVFSPINAPYNEDKTAELPTPLEIYEGDLREIESSGYVIFDLGNQLDPGLNLEIGVVCGINESRMTKEITPIGVLSDIRLETANKYEIPSFAMNHMVVGAFQKYGKIVSSFTEALELIKVMEEKNEGVFREVTN